MSLVRSTILLIVLGFGMFTAQACATPAELFIFEPSLQRIVGYGVINGSEFQLAVNSYSGSVKALWSRDKRPMVAYGGKLNAGQLQLIGSNNQTLELPKFLSDQGFFVRVVTTKVQTAQPIGIPSSNDNPKPATGGSNPPTPSPTTPTKPSTPPIPSKPPEKPEKPEKPEPPEKPEKPEPPEKPEKPEPPEKPKGSDRSGDHFNDRIGN
jgi:hypothetical protein